MAEVEVVEEDTTVVEIPGSALEAEEGAEDEVRCAFLDLYAVRRSADTSKTTVEDAGAMAEVVEVVADANNTTSRRRQVFDSERWSSGWAMRRWVWPTLPDRDVQAELNYQGLRPG